MYWISSAYLTQAALFSPAQKEAGLKVQGYLDCHNNAPSNCKGEHSLIHMLLYALLHELHPNFASKADQNLLYILLSVNTDGTGFNDIGSVAQRLSGLFYIMRIAAADIIMCMIGCWRTQAWLVLIRMSK